MHESLQILEALIRRIEIAIRPIPQRGMTRAEVITGGLIQDMVFMGVAQADGRQLGNFNRRDRQVEQLDIGGTGPVYICGQMGQVIELEHAPGIDPVDHIIVQIIVNHIFLQSRTKQTGQAQDCRMKPTGQMIFQH